MKLSVLITFYNQKDFVFDCLNSVITQKVNFEYEILIGDDGSNDGTIDEIQKFIEKYPNKIRLFVMPRDNSQRQDKFFRAGCNRANLIKYAKGEYLTICDGDDYYTDENKLQLQVDALNKYENCVGCGHDVAYWIQKEKIVKPFLDMGFVEGIITPENYLKNDVPFCTMVLMWRNLFKGKIPKSMKEHYFDDYGITLYMLNFGSLYYIQKTMAHYRITNNSLWQGSSFFEKIFRASVGECICLEINRKFSLHVRKKLSSFFLNLFKNKKLVFRLSSEDYNHFYEMAKSANAKHVLTILNWENETFYNKIKVYARYVAYIGIRKFL